MNLSVHQLHKVIGYYLDEIDRDKAMGRDESVEENKRGLHELAWQLVNETRPEEDES